MYSIEAVHLLTKVFLFQDTCVSVIPPGVEPEIPDCTPVVRLYGMSQGVTSGHSQQTPRLATPALACRCKCRLHRDEHLQRHLALTREQLVGLHVAGCQACFAKEIEAILAHDRPTLVRDHTGGTRVIFQFISAVVSGPPPSITNSYNLYHYFSSVIVALGISRIRLFRSVTKPSISEVVVGRIQLLLYKLISNSP